ncbi:MAG: hypothetical protein WCC52_07200 [Nitrosotalea sp.]
MTEKSDERWFILSIIMGALIATLYDVHQYWIRGLLEILTPNAVQYSTVLVKTLAGVLSALTAIGYYYFGFKRTQKKFITPMNVNLSVSSDHEGQRLLSDKVELSLYAASKYLEKVSSVFPNNSAQRAEFELIVEGFLLYMIAARDGILQKINSKLSSPLAERRVELNDMFKQQLHSDPNSKFQIILNMIEDCTQEPEKVISASNIHYWYWDRTKSWLWEINRMRNRIAHNRILGQQIAVVVGNNSGMVTKLIVDVIKKQPIVKVGTKTSRVPITTPKEETITENDIKKYLTECYSKLDMLKNDINRLL